MLQRKERPAHLGREYASQFEDLSVVRAYRHRSPYPPEVFAILLRLLGDQPRKVLDLGCGRGEIARRIARDVDRVDAIDPSAAMIAAGRHLSGGDHPHLRWVCARAEDAPLDPPYGLAAAGNSLHWMEWEDLFSRLNGALTPTARLAVVEVRSAPTPWAAPLRDAIRQFSTNREFQPYDLITELEERSLFAVEGREQTQPVPVRQTIDAYIESIHSRNGFSRERMSSAAAAAFDALVRRMVAPYARRGTLHHRTVAVVTWGRPAI